MVEMGESVNTIDTPYKMYELIQFYDLQYMSHDGFFLHYIAEKRQNVCI